MLCQALEGVRQLHAFDLSLEGGVHTCFLGWGREL